MIARSSVATSAIRSASEASASDATQRAYATRKTVPPDSVARVAVVSSRPLARRAAVTVLIASARRHGYAAYVGEGTNRWPAVHTLDAAELYRLALEKAPAGSRLHGASDEGVPFRQIATAIGRNLDIPVRSISSDEAYDYFGFLRSFAQMDNPTSSAITRELLGWTPTRPGLIADLDEGHYFREA